MANELRIKVVFDTGDAKQKTREYAEGTVGALEQSLKKARLALKEVVAGTQEHTAALANFKKIQAEVNDATGRGIYLTRNSTGASANATVTLQALNYTVRDSAYFTRDFALGMLAVGNNLNPLIDGFIRMRQETGSYKGAMNALLGTLTGPAGIMFAFSIIVTLIQAFTFQLSKSKKEAQDTAESFKNLSDKYRTFAEKLSDTQEEIQKGGIKDLGRIANAVTKELDSLNLELNELLKTAMTFQNIPMGGLFAQLFGATPEDIARILERMALLKGALEGGANRLGQNIFYAQTHPDKDLRKVFSDAELTNMASKLKEMGESLVPKMVGEFKIGNQVIQTTREEALKLANAIREIIDPPKAKSDSALKTLLLDLQGHAQVLAKELANMYQKANELFYFAPEGAGMQQVSMADYRKELQDRLKARMDIFGISMDKPSTKPEKGDALKAYDENLKETGKELKVVNELSSALSQSLYDAFMNGKKGVDEFVASLAVAIGKMLLMNALQYGLGMLFSPATAIGAGGKGFGTIFGSIQQAPIPTNAPISATSGVMQRLDAVNSNIAGMREPIIMIQADTDAVRFTRTKTNPAQAKLARANISVI